MKKAMAMIFVALLAGAHAYGQAEVTLRKELNILKPFFGKTWICEWIVETRDPPGRQTLHVLRRYEPMHGGKILKIYQECKELNSQTDGYYYYDPDKKEVAFLTLPRRSLAYSPWKRTMTWPLSEMSETTRAMSFLNCFLLPICRVKGIRIVYVKNLPTL